ncbi:MAG: amino acid ABC transporter substrate-binding protein [Pseudomonas sp.]|uniref:amino acid ABC transporter substrate-binding protein n=1 Tax=Pseudomonas sp. TaxID=306 RepID=UPI00339177DC
MSVPMNTSTRLLLACLLSMVSALACANTLERVRASNTLTLGYLPDFAPFSAQDGDKANGYAIDLCLKIADQVKTELGLPALQVRYQSVPATDAISAVDAGKVDILCSPTPPTLERRKAVSFTVPIYTAGLSVVVRQGAPQTLLNVLNGHVARTGPTWRATINQGLTNQTFAATAGAVTETWIRQQMRSLGVVATLVTAETTDAGLKLVADGKADAFFAERMLLEHLLNTKSSAGDLVLLERIFEYAPAAMAVDRDDDDFRLLVDSALSEMYRTGDIDRAYDKYLGGANDTDRKLFKVYALP